MEEGAEVTCKTCLGKEASTHTCDQGVPAPPALPLPSRLGQCSLLGCGALSGGLFCRMGDNIGRRRHLGWPATLLC